MVKRIRHEIREFFPVMGFFYLLFILSRLGGLAFIAIKGQSAQTSELYLLVSYLIQVAILVGLGILIAYNFSKELTSREGVKSFLTPMPGWKIILAKYLAILILCGVFFLLVQASSAFIQDGSMKPLYLKLRTAMLDRGILMGLVWGWFEMDGLALIYFILWWTMVYFFGAYTWTRLYYNYRRRTWALSVTFSQPLAFFLGIFCLDWLIYGVNRLLPLYIGKEDLGLHLAEKTPELSLTIQRLYHNGIGFLHESGGKIGEMAGYSLSSYALVLVLALIFFFLAQRYWEKLDR